MRRQRIKSCCEGHHTLSDQDLKSMGPGLGGQRIGQVESLLELGLMGLDVTESTTQVGG